MSFTLPKYHHPDFTQEFLAEAPSVEIGVCPADGVAPENYHATSIFPEYFKIDGEWILAEESRMDCVAVLEKGNKISTKEFRNLKAGDRVILGRTENGEEGIYLHAGGFLSEFGAAETFAFRTGRSRETSFTMDYDNLYNLLRHERENGYVVWVLGPACSFDSGARNAMADLIEHGYVHALMAGNALATHDLEGGLLHTALGQDIYTQEAKYNGHYNHIDVINKARLSGSIPAFVRQYNIRDGIIHACVKNKIPLVLAGSIRDDGPLPGVYADVYQAQNAMREQISKATTVICMATQLHTIATGNMTPSFRVRDGKIRPVYFYSVDMSEFVTNKLKDRGSLSAVAINANAQDVLSRLQKNLCGETQK